MKVLLSWLREFIDISLPPSDIAKTLVEIGLEVDAIETLCGVSLKEGTAIGKLYEDIVFDISITPNLAHCWSLYGIARELSAATGIALKKNPAPEIKESKKATGDAVAIKIEDKQNCPIYTCRIAENVRIAPSPDWMQKKLEASGIRPVNNVVDITNYVLLEFGHPLHAFDYDMLEGRKIIVRRAGKGEPFTTLDGKERLLHEEDLLICDGKKPIALGGVMGGENSEVSDSTSMLLIEAAYFNPRSIRRTSKRLGLMTEASKRFERGVDPNGLELALNRASELVQLYAQGKILSKIASVQAESFDEKVIHCKLSKTNAVLGTVLSVSEVEQIFRRLDFEAGWDGKDTFTVQVPTYRVDLLQEIDLIEEIARFYGYNNIENPRVFSTVSNIPNSPIYLFEKEIRTRLLTEGLQEFLTCDLIGPTLLEIVGKKGESDESFVQVLNPTSVEQSVLRTSLLPGLLQVLKYNYDRETPNICGFEIGRVHFKIGDQYKERSDAGILLSGNSVPQHWAEKEQEFDFFVLKGIVENILSELRIPDVLFKKNSFDTLHPGRRASIFSGSLELGSIGEVHPEVLLRLDVPQRVYFAELYLHELLQRKPKDTKMEEISVFPGSYRDLTLTLPVSLPIREVFKAISEIPSGFLDQVTLISMYSSDKLGSDKVNATFRFLYKDRKKTIDQETVDAEHALIINQANRLIKE